MTVEEERTWTPPTAAEMVRDDPKLAIRVLAGAINCDEWPPHLAEYLARLKIAGVPTGSRRATVSYLVKHQETWSDFDEWIEAQPPEARDELADDLSHVQYGLEIEDEHRWKYGEIRHRDTGEFVELPHQLMWLGRTGALSWDPAIDPFVLAVIDGPDKGYSDLLAAGARVVLGAYEIDDLSADRHGPTEAETGGETS